MAKSRNGPLSDQEIVQMINFDESDLEEEDSDKEIDLEECREGVPDQEIPLENEEEWNDSDDEPLSSLRTFPQLSRDLSLRWKHIENFDFTPNEELDVSFDSSAIVKSSLDYFSHYIDNRLFEIMAECTNVCRVLRTGKSLNTTPYELRQFFGCSMAMSVLGLPRIRMYWALETKVYYIANTITRNRYFQLRSSLKLVNDELISQNTRQNDKFWKIRPIVSAIEKGCRENKRDKCVAIDEQIIPFTGKCKQKQVVKGKPNPEGIKVILMANPNGIPLDLYLYQGKGTTTESALYPTPDKLDLGGRFVLKLVDTLPRGSSIFIDRYFTSISLLDNLLGREIKATGTLMKNRVPEYQRPNAKKKNKSALFKSDAMLQKTGRGSFDCVVRGDNKMAVVKWFDSKPIYVASTDAAVQPLGTCRRWSKQKGEYIEVQQPVAIKNYNKFMGGIDLLDRIISKYPMRGRTGKWTIRTIFHFFDFAAAAGWLQYRQDAAQSGCLRKDILQYLDFKLDLAKKLIYSDPHQSEPLLSLQLTRVTRNMQQSPTSSVGSIRSTRNSPSARASPVSLINEKPSTSTRKQRLVEPLPHAAKRVKEAKHLPTYAKETQNNRSKCRNKGCRNLTFVKCSECNIFLCFNVIASMSIILPNNFLIQSFQSFCIFSI